MSQNWPGSARDLLPPPGGVTTPKIKKTRFGSCDISIESPWKALFKYVNWMLIWPLIWPSAAENDRKMTGKSFFYNCFFSGEHVHTKWDKKLIFYMDIGSDLYFHIMNQNWPGSTRDPPPRGVTTPKIKKNTFWVMWHINRKHMKSSTQICQLNAHLTTHLTVSSWKWPENRFFITVFFRGACPHRMR